MIGDECICKGNWRDIIKDTSDLFDRKYLNREGEEYIFVGVLHGSDDYYYVMWNTATSISQLLSCVGSIESFGYTAVQDLYLSDLWHNGGGEE